MTIGRSEETPVFPYDDPQAWQATIGALSVDMRVCVVDVKNLKTGNKYDVKEAAGVDGGLITHHGRKLATWDLVLRAWKPEGAKILHSIVALAHKQPDEIAKAAKSKPLTSGGNARLPSAVAISHPLLRARGISAVYFAEIQGPEHTSGMIEATISCVEFRGLQLAGSKAASKSATLKVADVPTAFNGPGASSESRTPPMPSKSGGFKP